MKVAITGHTKGIGAAIHTWLSSQGHEVIGFSRSTGYDISNEEIQKQIVNLASDCDLFVNNAFAGSAQSNLLLKFWYAWNDSAENKMILNIGSRAAIDYRKRVKPMLYDMHKLGLRELSNDLAGRPGNVRVYHLTLGYVDVLSTKLKDVPKLDINAVLGCIEFMLSVPAPVQIRDVVCEVKQKI